VVGHRWSSRRQSVGGAGGVREEPAHDVRELLGRITSPTLVIQRSDVTVLPVALGRYLADNIPGARLVEIPGHDLLWWVGDVDTLLDEVEAFLTGTTGVAPKRERMLATLLFADVVASTERAAQIGDRRWRELLQTYHEVVSREIDRFGGRRVSTDGDGLLAIFQLPADGVRCGAAAVGAVASLGIDLRVGVHTGEVEVVQDDVAGLGVHIAARVMSAAGAGEVLVSRTVVDLVTGSGIEFEDRGEHDLKGVPGSWRLFKLNP
jgi:class 3 adenylate cyclase